MTPTLDRAKEALLSEFNVAWLPLTAKDFAERVLVPLHDDIAEGIRFLSSRVQNARKPLALETVSQLQSSSGVGKGRYLLGHEPTWKDIQDAIAIKRSVDEDLWMQASAELGNLSAHRAILVSGTAGSGKSTALMRLALRLTAEGVEVGWIDRDTDLTTYDILSLMRGDGAPAVLAIDDADVFGGALSGLVQSILDLDSHPLVIIGLRSGKVDRVLSSNRLAGVEVKEVSMPHLSDEDIVDLIGLLDRENLLGVLRNKSLGEQVAAFKDRAGRQLLVAMYEATSGRRFEEKVADEYEELLRPARDLYALVSIASHFQYSLPMDELLLAVGSPGNVVLNELRSLEARKLIIHGKGSRLKARHRMIAAVVVEHLQRTSGLAQYLEGLIWAAATRVSPELQRQKPQWKFLKKLISHETLFRLTSVSESRQLYASVEELLKWDFHFWLQRGSLEVEEGDLDLAENYLAQAKALQPDDPYVLTEWAYFLLRRASERPAVADAKDSADEGIRILQARITSAGDNDSYPYHVLGAQGLSWARRGKHTSEQRRKLLVMLSGIVSQGVAKHPNNAELKQLLGDLKKEELDTVVKVRGNRRASQ